MATAAEAMPGDLAPGGDLPLLPPLPSEVGRNPPVPVSVEQRREYEELGYTLFPSLIDASTIAELQRAVDAMVEHNVGDFSFEPSDPSLIQRITGPHRHSRAFAALTRHPALCGVVAKLIGARQLALLNLPPLPPPPPAAARRRHILDRHAFPVRAEVPASPARRADRRALVPAQQHQAELQAGGGRQRRRVAPGLGVLPPHQRVRRPGLIPFSLAHLSRFSAMPAL